MSGGGRALGVVFIKPITDDYLYFADFSTFLWWEGGGTLLKSGKVFTLKRVKLII